ncbi:chorismate-binding protein [Streptomyces sp. CRN 30]|uniref:chorismate-binding protein n=1 Tax=Streptomyces sp. CRN 30 TaxID=3075613 RepID=UPI002A83471F|nr:chorismate-binding protein [Streptomyces sp. CRN 30]
MSDLPPLARFGDRLATGLLDVTSDPAALESAGFWAVCAEFEGRLTCARFADVRSAPVPAPRPGRWRGPAVGDWETSLDHGAYTAAVRRIRAHIEAGEVYQANLCRILSAPVPPGADVDALTSLLARGNPAPYAGTIRLPRHGVEIAGASPELFLRRAGRTVESGPIKGTGRTEADLLEKDHAENVMIVDLVRNDIGRVCETGSVTVPDLCAVEKHPGLVHLVSTVRGELRAGAGWPDLFAAAFPPGSVTGAPKSSALRIIDALEPAGRGPYCGGIGWVDADRGTGELAVGIRTFWIDRAEGLLKFGTGAGITWGSDPEREWRETELKASRLLAVASGSYRAIEEGAGS